MPLGIVEAVLQRHERGGEADRRDQKADKRSCEGDFPVPAERDEPCHEQTDRKGERAAGGKQQRDEADFRRGFPVVEQQVDKRADAHRHGP